MNWGSIEKTISGATGKPFKVNNSRTIGGGSINSAYLIEGDDDKFFVKTNSSQFADMFAAEAEGLLEIHNAKTIKAPKPICWDTQGTKTFIVMEYLNLGRGNRHSAKHLGKQLAEMHRVNNPRFGWHRDNTIGSTEQINTPDSNWIDFYREKRLEFQISLAANHGYNGQLQSLGSKICDNLEKFFDSYQPLASLLHGDLWSGNYSYDDAGEPVIFDPAVYYGDREADIAMTELFGGFSPEFYQSYEETFPLDAGYVERKQLYNLYHILNHLNLFGGGYYGQAVGMMERLVVDAGL